MHRPILFSAPMVRALLNGSKTQTRRIVKPQGAAMRPMLEADGTPRGDWFISYPKFARVGNTGFKCPYGRPGDHLWVRETWASVPATAYRGVEVYQTVNPNDANEAAIYAAEWDRSGPARWRPSIHMPRWASRITLEVTKVRAERLNEISNFDCKSEGIDIDKVVSYQRAGADRPAAHAYRDIWEDINGPGSWAANPWVWCVEFRTVAP
jgi:hypothetical protein